MIGEWLYGVPNAFLGFVASRYLDIFTDLGGQRVVNGVKIVGNEYFQGTVEKAMVLLSESDQSGFRLVKRYVESVVASDKSISFGPAIGVHFQVLSGSEVDWPASRIAACLVRSAVYIRLISGYKVCVWSGQSAQLLALKRELRSMERLGCHRLYIEEQLRFIDSKGR